MVSDDYCRALYGIESETEKGKVDGPSTEVIECRYRQLVSNIKDVIFALDMDRRITYMSPSISAMLGYDIEDVMGRSLFQFLESDSGKLIGEILSQGLLKHESGEQDLFETGVLELAFKHKDGRTVWGDVELTLIPDPAGRPYEILGVVHDLSERKHMEAILKKNEAKYRSLIDKARVGVTFVDLDGKITHVNDALCRIVGYSKSELMGREFIEFLHPKDRGRILQLFFEAFERPENFEEIEFRVMHKYGHILYVNARPTIFTYQGEIEGFNAIITDITELKQKTMELQQALKDWQDTFDAVPDIVAMISPDFDIIKLNLEGYRKLGLKQEDLVGKKCYEIIHGTQCPIDECPCAKTIKSKEPRTGEFSQSGSHYIATASPILNNHNELVAMAHTVKDITERKKAEDAMKESEEKYRSLFHSMLDGFAYHEMVFDDEGVPVDYIFLEVNEAFEKLTGLKREDIIGRRVTEVIPGIEADPAGWIQRYGDVASHGTKIQFEQYAAPLDRRYSVSTYSPKKGFFAAVFEDITVKKKTKDALKESEEKFRELANLLPETIFLADESGELTFVNQAGRDAFGYAEADISSGFNIMQALVPEDRERGLTNISKLLSEDRSKGREYTAMRKDGSTFPVVIYANAVNHNGKYAGVRGLVVDITERKRAEDEIECALEEKKLLLRELKHRVNNNLQLLMSMISMWVRDTDEKAVREALQEVEGLIRTMALVHSEAFDDSGEKGINLKNFMRELSRGIIRVKSPEQIAVSHSVEGDDVLLNLEQANPLSLIANELLVNAMKHAFVGRSQGHIAINLNENNGNIVLSVKDDGVGMDPEEDLANTDSMGLELVQNLVGQLKGKMDIRIGGGTAFIIEFPKV